MSRHVIGKCSICGGLVTLPEYHHSVTPPVPKCKKCGAVADNLPTIPMTPIQPHDDKRCKGLVYIGEKTWAKFRLWSITLY